MPRVLSLTDLRPRLAEALRSVEGGEHVMLTRYSKPAVALIAASRTSQLERLARASAQTSRSSDPSPANRGGFRLVKDKKLDLRLQDQAKSSCSGVGMNPSAFGRKSSFPAGNLPSRAFGHTTTDAPYRSKTA